MSRAISAKSARERANIAAAVIRRGGGFYGGRELSNCLEMGDGDEVVRILRERARKRPTSKLAQNLHRYLNPE